MLAAQLAYARERGLPLVFHQREAHDDFVAALRAGYDPRAQRGIVHCFTGDARPRHGSSTASSGCCSESAAW